MSTDSFMPSSARWVGDFIQRIGFPIFIACAIAIYHVWYISRVQERQDNNSTNIAEALNKNTEAVTALRHFLTHKYE